tara:strand:- start:18 stop:188 length:171 start_codon:yes stop_codon:yes gene_type:complete
VFVVARVDGDDAMRCDAIHTLIAIDGSRWIAMDDRPSIGVRSRPPRETISALERDD